MSELRDEIRVSVGRYERVESTAFTKEALAAICDAVDADVDTDQIPPKPEMRAGIREAVPDLDAGESDRPFRKAELVAISDAVGGE